MSEHVDVIIIGAGTAGLSAMREMRKKTEDFLLVHDGSWGTTCAAVGCMPSNALVEAADAFHRRNDFEDFGLKLPRNFQELSGGKDLRQASFLGQLQRSSMRPYEVHRVSHNSLDGGDPVATQSPRPQREQL